MNRIKKAAEVLGWPSSQKVRIKIVQVTTVIMGVSTILFSSGAALATSLANASTSISDPRPSATAVSYTFKGGAAGGLVTSSLIKCVKAIVSNSATTTTAPTGFSGTGATVNAASSTLINSSATGWTLVTSDGTASSGQNNIFTYTNTTGVTPSTTTGATFISLASPMVQLQILVIGSTSTPIQTSLVQHPLITLLLSSYIQMDQP